MIDSYLMYGYRMVRPDGPHPRANSEGFVFEHILIAERAVGHHLAARHPVHHWNSNRSDNRNENLVVCASHAYHSLLHQRMRAMDACGNANYRKCAVCKEYDDPANLKFYGRWAVHAQCHAQKQASLVNAKRITPKRLTRVTDEMADSIRRDLRGPAQLARALGISPSYVSNIRANRKRKS